MSSKLKLNSTAGGSLSLVVDDTLLTDETFNVSVGGIESGSNTNGNYTKFPDGTLICRSKTSGSLTGESTWTFPYAFSTASDLSLTGGAQTSSAFSINIVFKLPSLSAVDFSAYNSADVRVANGIGMLAIGRWK